MSLTEKHLYLGGEVAFSPFDLIDELRNNGPINQQLGQLCARLLEGLRPSDVEEALTELLRLIPEHSRGHVSQAVLTAFTP